VKSALSYTVDAAPDFLVLVAEAEQESIAWREDVRVRARRRLPHEPDHASSLRRWAWLFAIALHLILVVALRHALNASDSTIADSDVMQVHLLDPPATEPALPEPVPFPPRVFSHVERTRQRPMPTPPTSPLEPPPVLRDEAQLRLFNPDGSAQLPDDFITQLDRSRPQPDFIPRKYEPSPLLQAKRPLKVRPNHFAQYWAGTDGMPLHEAMWQHLTVVKEFTAPWGGKYACAWILILVACGDVPDKPWNPPTTWKPATEEDEY
jgi:hypothetical protein